MLMMSARAYTQRIYNLSLSLSLCEVCSLSPGLCSRHWQQRRHTESLSRPRLVRMAVKGTDRPPARPSPRSPAVNFKACPCVCRGGRVHVCVCITMLRGHDHHCMPLLYTRPPVFFRGWLRRNGARP